MGLKKLPLKAESLSSLSLLGLDISGTSSATCSNPLKSRQENGMGDLRQLHLRHDHNVRAPAREEMFEICRSRTSANFLNVWKHCRG